MIANQSPPSECLRYLGYLSELFREPPVGRSIPANLDGGLCSFRTVVKIILETVIVYCVVVWFPRLSLYPYVYMLC